jgi:hypothetical protein
MIIKTHCDKGGNDGTAGQQVAEGSAFGVGHGKRGLLTSRIVAQQPQAVNPGACLQP